MMNFDKRCEEIWAIFMLSSLLSRVLLVFKIIESYFNSVSSHNSACLIIKQ